MSQPDLALHYIVTEVLPLSSLFWEVFSWINVDQAEVSEQLECQSMLFIFRLN